MCKNEKRTCKAFKTTVFHCWICKFVTFFRPRRRGCLSSRMSPLSSSTLEKGLTRETSVSLTLYHGNSTLINLFDSIPTRLWSVFAHVTRSPYLHNETKGRICIKMEFNPKRIFHSSNMAAVSLFTPPTWPLWRHANKLYCLVRENLAKNESIYYWIELLSVSLRFEFV